MRVLVTGITGVVGSYIVKELLRTESVDKIVGISRSARHYYEDHSDKDSQNFENPYLECYGNLIYPCTRLITQFKPTHIIHAAGMGNPNTPARDVWKANVDTTFNLLEACKLLQSHVKFIYCSSIVVNNPKNLYSYSKLTGENLVECYSRTNTNIWGKVVRFCAVAGAGNKHGVVRDIVAKLIDRSNPFHMELISNSVKPFCYASQLAKHIVEIIQENTPDVVTLCPDSVITVDQIAYKAMQLTGFKKEISWNKDGVWIGDSQKVEPVPSYKEMYSSGYAVELGIKDILREDYGIA